MNLEISSEVITAAAVVSEFEKGDGQVHHSAASSTCANCAAPLSGRFCQACGQNAHIHRSLLHMFEEMMHGLFHFETKAWRTIPALIFKPGQLTRQYIEGKRTSFVSPLALFFFLIFLMFFVFSLTSNETKPKEEKKEDIASVTLDLSHAKEELLAHETELASLVKNKQDTSDQLQEVLDAREEVFSVQTRFEKITGQKKSPPELAKEQLAAETKLAALKAQPQPTTINPEQNFELQKEKKFIEQDIRLLKKKKLKSVLTSGGAEAFDGVKDDSMVSISSSASKSSDRDSNHTERAIENWIESSGWKKRLEHADKNRELIAYKMQKNASGLAFLLMPISLPFLWLLFSFRRRYRQQYKMFDHAIFSLYSLSFMSGLITLMSILAYYDWTKTAGLLFAFVPPLHMYKQLRGAYQLSRFSALWRTVALLFIAALSLLLYAIIVMSMSV
ncbi:MAG: DUF3667 domain-containing protein [Undibacterium sp.]|nr:DUF3667 domain-containing protein [Undibacterium sp.]